MGVLTQNAVFLYCAIILENQLSSALTRTTVGPLVRKLKVVKPTVEFCKTLSTPEIKSMEALKGPQTETPYHLDTIWLNETYVLISIISRKKEYDFLSAILQARNGTEPVGVFHKAVDFKILDCPPTVKVSDIRNRNTPICAYIKIP